jgi:deoxyribonuclease V
VIACLDVHYRDASACAAAVMFHDWTEAVAVQETVIEVADIQPYQPGEFYRRELPCLLAILKTLSPVDAVVIDGYVWLDDQSRPGLGAHLYEALQQRVPVIGVAKTSFRGSVFAKAVLRGTSRRPLHVTAAGMDADVGAQHVRSMHGEFRIPTLLKRVDQLCREGASG